MSTKTDTPKDYQPVLRTIPYYLQGDDRVGYRHHRRRPVPRDTGGDAAMTPTVDVYYGDAWELAPTLEPQSINCIVTSPPYWGLRDYGHPGQFGLESTPQEYVAKLVELFARLRPALKDEGTLWLNLGDSYVGSCALTTNEKALKGKQGTSRGTHGNIGKRDYAATMKPKDLVGIPWRVAFALQEDGWYLRSDIIWSKPNPMPESVTDRPTKAHEYVFLLAKSKRYYFDQEAVREPHARLWDESNGGNMAHVTNEALAHGSGWCHRGDYPLPNPNGRNIRTVWTIATKPYSGAHFATMPPELAERCIKAGTSKRGVCADCGRPWVRVVAKETSFESGSGRAGRSAEEVNASGKWRNGGRVGNANLKLGSTVTVETLSWQPTCPCGADPIPATVLDPFVGSGTTLYVARKLGRNSIGFELNEGYRPLIEDRLKQGVLL